MIDWTGLDDFEDSEITYLLYMEGLSVEQIVKVRNMDATLVNDHIINEKLKRRTTSRKNLELRLKSNRIAGCTDSKKYKKEKKIELEKQKISQEQEILGKQKVNQEQEILEKQKISQGEETSEIKYKDVNSFLIMDKEYRLKLIQNIDGEDVINFKRDIYRRMVYEENADDLMALIWTAGELKDPGYIPLIESMATKRHASIRRLSYSALGKIAHEDGLTCLYKGLDDQMPQCRQYAARAIGKIGKEESIEKLKEAYQKEKRRTVTKEYILRAIEMAIEEISERNNK